MPPGPDACSCSYVLRMPPPWGPGGRLAYLECPLPGQPVDRRAYLGCPPPGRLRPSRATEARARVRRPPPPVRFTCSSPYPERRFGTTASRRVPSGPPAASCHRGVKPLRIVVRSRSGHASYALDAYPLRSADGVVRTRFVTQQTLSGGATALPRTPFAAKHAPTVRVRDRAASAGRADGLARRRRWPCVRAGRALTRPTRGVAQLSPYRIVQGGGACSCSMTAVAARLACTSSFSNHQVSRNPISTSLSSAAPRLWRNRRIDLVLLPERSW